MQLPAVQLEWCDAQQARLVRLCPAADGQARQRPAIDGMRAEDLGHLLM